MTNLVVFLTILNGFCSGISVNITQNITNLQVTNKESGKLSYIDSTCNNVTACVECNENKCYTYDNIAKSCEKAGQQKSDIIMYQIFFGFFGGAAFVVGDDFTGSIQLGLILSPLVWIFIYACPIKLDIKDKIVKTMVIVCYITASVVYIWYLIQISDGTVTGEYDGEECPLI